MAAVRLKEAIEVACLNDRLSGALTDNLDMALNLQVAVGRRVYPSFQENSIVLGMGIGGADGRTQADVARGVLASGGVYGGAVLERVNVVNGGGEAAFQLLDVGATWMRAGLSVPAAAPSCASWNHV